MALHARSAALTLAVLLVSGAAHAQSEPQQDPPADPQPAPTQPSPPPANDPLTKLPPPPAQPRPVPDPSPVVMGGRPTAPDVVGTPLTWKRSRFGTADYVLTGAGAVLTLASAIIKPLSSHNLGGGILFDDSVRNAIRPSSTEARYAFRDASDVGLSTTVVAPFFIDALASAWWWHGSRDVAEQMALRGLETMAVIGGLQGVTNTLVSRERPYGQNCDTPDLPSNAIDCTSNSHYRSFFSGHSSFSFTAAALVCFDHFEYDLFGGPWDGVMCATAYGFAATTATFRVVADVHYASDVIAGAMMGTIVGYGVPLLHRKVPDVNEIKTNGATMRIVPMGTGLGVVGSF